MSIVEVRKVISAPEIKKSVIEICTNSGITYSEYAYGLILDDIIKRQCEKKLSSDIASEKFSVKSLLGEVQRVLEKYSREISSK